MKDWQDGDEIPAWWEPDPGHVDDVDPICGHRRNRCRGCGVCLSCDGCYCDEE